MKLRSVCVAVLVLALGATACQQPAETASNEGPEGDAAISPAPEGNVVEIEIQGLSFRAPAQIPAGWTTFRMKNASPMVHFAIIERMPEGFGLVEQQEQIAPLFQAGMDLLNQGDSEAANAKFGELPEWFGQIVFLGGPGLTSGGETSQTSLLLEPGTYLLECYVKTGGIFHSYNPAPEQYGMVHEFIVTEEDSGESEPEATLKMTISKEGGIEAPDSVEAGEQTVAVHFADQGVHENFVGHDVHLARLEADTDLERLEGWMNWMAADGLETPSPVRFLGGTNEMPAGSTAYVTVAFEPGRYAWIAEVPNTQEKRMLKVFEVTGGE